MRWRLLIAALIAGLGLTFAGVRALQTVEVSGVVLDKATAQPVAGATVRQQTTANATTSGPDGTFTLGGLTEGVSVTITAWHEGYHPAGVEVVPPATGVVISLTLHPTGDNPDYEWLTSMPDPENPIGCGHCMVAFPQWVNNAHAQSAVNPRFFSIYNGTDTTGQPNVPPGYKLDFPNTAGNCANCHAPGAAANEPFTADMNELEGVETEGVFCDFCHKIGYAYLDPTTGLPYPNVPGVMSVRLYRPPPDTHMFFGPFDDVTRRVSYLELEKKSQFCAPCHQFSFWGTPIYESFREWLESPYPGMGIECQTCHMAPTGVNYFVYPEKGGLIRDPDLIASHLQPGASDVELLQNTVSMTVTAELVVDRVQVTVTITNTGAGHHVPTDFPGRHMILVVSAADGQGQPLPLQSGSTVPDWGGDLAGQPGKAFAKVLRDLNSGEEPTVAYWNPTIVVSDNRIPAFGADTSVYEFAAPPTGTVNVEATLIFRRAFWELMQAKRWDTPDVVMEQEMESIVIP